LNSLTTFLDDVKLLALLKPASDLKRWAGWRTQLKSMGGAAQHFMTMSTHMEQP